MMCVVFRNNGVLDPRSIKTFGVSVKLGNNPIGYFGTGLKYAIAILLRTKHEVVIQSGGHTYVFKSKIVEVRGKDFEVITMNGEELPFTTELGKNWELWQAFRELYCNAIDEGGSVFLEDENDLRSVYPKENETQVIVIGRDFAKLYHERDSIVLNLPVEIMCGSGDVELYRKRSDFAYYRGIRVGQFPRPAILTYNIKSELELTEDRTVKHSHLINYRNAIAVAGLKDKDLIREILTCDKSFYERDLDFSSLHAWSEKVSDEFDEVIKKEFDFNNDFLNLSAKNYYIKKKNKSASKNYERAELTTVEKQQLERCKKVLNKVYRDFSDYEIMIVKNLGQSTMALADMGNRTMVISQASFYLGTKFLLSTMIEEYFHLKTGHYDCSRELQTYLFDSICSMIENHVIREPI